MAIQIITSNEKFELTDKNKQEIRPKLEALLVPNMPVMVEEKESRSLLHSSTTRHLLFANGTRNGTFIPRSGKRGRAYAVAYGEKNEFNHYSLVRCWTDAQAATKLIMPWSATTQEHGCIDHNPVDTWTSFSHGGTTRIMIGDPVTALYADALESIKFVEGGYKFQLHSFYAMPGYCVGEAGVSNDEERTRNRKASSLVCVSAVMNLLRMAARETKTFKSELHAQQINPKYPRVLTSIRNRDYPVNNGDFYIKEIMHPERLLGFVKVGAGVQFGDIFLYPAKEAEALFEHALSDDVVNKCYPIRE